MLANLIKKFQRNNDQHAFTEIVKVCQSDLRGYCRRLTAGDLAFADDIAQESLITAFQQLGKLNNINAFKSWLYRIAYRNFLQQLRKQKEVFVEDEIVVEIESQHENEQMLLQLMRHLSAEQRAVITLNFTLGYGHDEIAALLEMPIGTVKSHCKRGKDKMIALGQPTHLGAA